MRLISTQLNIIQTDAVTTYLVERLEEGYLSTKNLERGSGDA